MRAELFKEETEHGAGGDVKTSPQARALEVKMRILALVDSGRFILGGGYQCKTEGACAGCAVGALAWSFGVDTDDFTPSGPGGAFDFDLRVAPVRAGLCSREEIVQLEMGYEGACYLTITGFAQIEANKHDPFYVVGNELRRRAGKTSCPAIEVDADAWENLR